MEQGIRIRTIVLIWIYIAGVSGMFAQSCLPDGITFNLQSEIDNFQSNHPNCTEIEGFVTIRSDNITNLNGLSVLTSIGGDLFIDGTYLVNLTGLDNLSTIGGSLIIGDESLSGWNRHLVSLSGLEGLMSVGTDLWLSKNIILEDITALSNISAVNGFLQIEYNDSLMSLSGLHNIGSVGSHLVIRENNVLQNLIGLDNLMSVSGSLAIWDNQALVDISGLDSLESIGESLRIDWNSALTNISALSGLTALGGGITIEGNSQLADITALININSFTEGGIIYISMNQALSSLSGLDSIDAESITELEISSNGMLSECAVKSICDYLADPNGGITIYSNDTGCANQAEVEAVCTVGIPEQSSDPKLSTYPNPFTTSTTIEYELTEPSHVQLTIYNTIGETVYKAEDRLMPVGKHTFTWSPKSLPEGMYYGVLRSEEGVSVVKMVKQ